MTALFYVFLYTTLLIFYYWIYLEFFAGRVLVKARIKEIQGTDRDFDDGKELTFAQRIIQPLYNRFFHYLQRITPSAIRTEYEEALEVAGLGQKMTYTNLIIIQILAAMIAVLSIVSFVDADNKTLLTVALAGLFFYLPVGYIRLRASKRKEEILRDLPGFLDLVYVTVEAGLSFDQALQNTLERTKGPLAEEFSRTMDEIRHGRGRPEAFYGLANRTQLEELREFVTSIILAEELGSNIGNVLRVQAATMRKHRKQRAEEAAAKIPVKMTFPLVLLMFPALFIVILGPAVINIIESLF